MNITDRLNKTHLYLTNNHNEAIIHASNIAKKLTQEIEAMIKPGISESEATESAHLVFKKYHIEKTLAPPSH